MKQVQCSTNPASARHGRVPKHLLTCTSDLHSSVGRVPFSKGNVRNTSNKLQTRRVIGVKSAQLSVYLPIYCRDTPAVKQEKLSDHDWQ